MFHYILRYYIDPGFAEEKRIAELSQLCRAGRIEEVMFFYNPEELFQGYPPDEEVKAWFALAKKVKAALDAEGVAMSINPWTTTVHVSRGRVFSEKQRSFQPMVGETGTVSPITACPFDPHWQRWLGDFFARIAEEISPVAIWVEDDWRLHNHEPDMKYGGCFCPLHLARFEQETGIRTTREELLKNLLAPGRPHPWRKPWLKVCRDSLLEPARMLYEKVHAANPSVRLGLMSSGPDVHSTEGRDWNLLRDALSPGAPLLVRPHLPPYTETFALDVSPAVTRQTISEYDGPIEIYPELENSPRCGRYSKSGAYSIFECLHSALFGSSGITINHYDMMGNGLALDYDFPAALAEAKDRLDAIEALKLSDRNAEGVQVLYSPEIAAHMRTAPDAGSISNLVNHSVGWSNTFFKLGVSHAMSGKITDGSIRAVSGQTLRAFSDAEIETLLAGDLILDAPSAEILLERGFGNLIGVSSAEWRTLNADGYAYEDIPDGKEALYGVDAPRMSASRCAFQVLAMHTSAETPSLIRRYDRSVLYPGTVFHENHLGGKTLAIAYPLETAQFNMGYFNNFRRIFLHDLLLNRFGAKKILLGCDTPLQTYRNSNGKLTVIALLNPTHDTYPAVRFFAPGLNPADAMALGKDGIWRNAGLASLPDGSMKFSGTLATLDALVLKFES